MTEGPIAAINKTKLNDAISSLSVMPGKQCFRLKMERTDLLVEQIFVYFNKCMEEINKVSTNKQTKTSNDS